MSYEPFLGKLLNMILASAEVQVKLDGYWPKLNLQDNFYCKPLTVNLISYSQFSRENTQVDMTTPIWIHACKECIKNIGLGKILEMVYSMGREI